jgi:hypothetical protein
LLSLTLLRAFFVISIKGERLQTVEIPRTWEKALKERTVVFKLIIGSLERG